MAIDTSGWWIFGTTIEHHRYKASFGSGFSSLSQLRSFAWNPQREEFLTGFQPDALAPMRWTQYPCSEAGAYAILRRCKLESHYLFSPSKLTATRREMYADDDFCFTLQTQTVPERRQASTDCVHFEVTFYDPDWHLQTISMQGKQLSAFEHTLAVCSSAQIAEKLKGDVETQTV